MTSPIRTIEVNDALLEGETEIYIVDFSPEGSPSAATAAIFVKGESTDLASTIFTGGSGTCTVSGSLVTVPAITVRTGDGTKTYRLVVAATLGSRTRKVAYEIPLARPYGD